MSGAGPSVLSSGGGDKPKAARCDTSDIGASAWAPRLRLLRAVRAPKASSLGSHSAASSGNLLTGCSAGAAPPHEAAVSVAKMQRASACVHSRRVSTALRPVGPRRPRCKAYASAPCPPRASAQRFRSEKAENAPRTCEAGEAVSHGTQQATAQPQRQRARAQCEHARLLGAPRHAAHLMSCSNAAVQGGCAIRVVVRAAPAAASAASCRRRPLRSVSTPRRGRAGGA
jgi:hypothetical protein